MSNCFGTGEVLDRAGCVALLATGGIGRVVFTQRALPAVRPVRFVLRDDAVWFRVPHSDVWFANALDTVVAVAADDLTADLTAGWFVTVLGTATEVRDHETIEALATLLPPARGADDRYVRVPVESVSGRQLAPCEDVAR
jgi:nitroimidazol reductase NimA-like FMN-containing flavoprotein (pyridoxamine 5'-phosphate oxidase superfamily)